jgi:molybdopterin/thiamine biosynthesis adenylyltransferase
VILAVRPSLHRELVAAGDSRTLAQLERLGLPAGEEPDGSVVAISLPPEAEASRRLLASALLDYTLRLDPLVREVRLEGFEPWVVEELRIRFPLEIVEAGQTGVDLTVAVGRGAEADLSIDAGGWICSLGEQLDLPEDPGTNPLGPLAGACLGAGEIFKALFASSYPEGGRRFRTAEGLFSCFDYDAGQGPALSDVTIDAHLLGLGGVGAGVIRVLSGLGPRLLGSLALIDRDYLDLTNLNRVTYATLAEARAKEPKALVAAARLLTTCPNLSVDPRLEELDAYCRSLGPRRSERTYDVLLTALDNDEARHSAQRELPRVLIDGSTGTDFNARVERIVFGEWGCLGCTRQTPPPSVPDPAGCGNIADPHAPSVSFLAAFPGVLAAGELIKEALGGEAALRGEFQHIFHGGPNPELRAEPARREDCLVGCHDDSPALDVYRRKYA